jgi:hypothetical protein
MISDDAKVALANARQVAARRRLERDGALSREAIRRRLQWVAHDRKLAPAEITKAMSTRNIVAF